MNSVQLVGRLTRDPDVRYTNGGSSIARFTVAVDRRFRSEGGPTADFPAVIAFGKTAEFIERYFRQGQRIGITGRIQTRSYTKEDGTKVYTTDVVAENVEFVESKGSQGDQAGVAPEPKPSAVGDGFVDVPAGVDEELPFQ